MLTMGVLTLIVVFILTFAFVYIIDLIFKSCLFYPYITFLHDVGLIINPFVIKWESTRFNRLFYKWSTYKPTFLRMWFQTGTYIALICMIPAFCLVSHSFWQNLESSPSQPNLHADSIPSLHADSKPSLHADSKPSFQPNSQHRFKLDSPTSSDEIEFANYDNNSDGSGSKSRPPMLMPIIPGLTLPFSQTLFYLFTMFLCMVIHEMGHALASSRENVAIEGVGIGFYGLILPLAYVKLPADRLNDLLPWQQLRIFCAGIWHNIVLSGFALLLLWCNPLILWPAYQSGHGVSVLSVKEGSAMSQPGGLDVNDQIFSVNDCEVRYIKSWGECLEYLNVNADRGFCASKNFVKFEDIIPKDENVTDCCPVSSDYLCFKDLSLKERFCLPGRGLAEEAKVCNKNADCGEGMCLVPDLGPSNDKFVKIERHFRTPVLFVGTIKELQSTVTVSTWIAKYKAIPVRFADIYETILVYIVMFSSGLAIVNLIPCYGLDGAYLMQIIVHYYMSSIVTKLEHRNFIIILFNTLGLFMLVYSIICGAVKHM